MPNSEVNVGFSSFSEASSAKVWKFFSQPYHQPSIHPNLKLIQKSKPIVSGCWIRNEGFPSKRKVGNSYFFNCLKIPCRFQFLLQSTLNQNCLTHLLWAKANDAFGETIVSSFHDSFPWNWKLWISFINQEEGSLCVFPHLAIQIPDFPLKGVNFLSLAKGTR